MPKAFLARKRERSQDKESPSKNEGDGSQSKRGCRDERNSPAQLEQPPGVPDVEDKNTSADINPPVVVLWHKDGVASMKKTFVCILCSKVFSTAYQLRRHLATHAGERTHICPVCQASFVLSSSLSHHLKSHRGTKDHICVECGQAFSRSSALASHKKTHSANKAYCCPICSKSFHQKGNLVTHMNVHEGIRPFVCSECGRSFTQLSNLKDHLWRVHQVKHQHSCALCGESFEKRKDLRHHERTVHKGALKNTAGKSSQPKATSNSTVQVQLSDRPAVLRVGEKQPHSEMLLKKSIMDPLRKQSTLQNPLQHQLKTASSMASLDKLTKLESTTQPTGMKLHVVSEQSETNSQQERSHSGEGQISINKPDNIISAQENCDPVQQVRCNPTSGIKAEKLVTGFVQKHLLEQPSENGGPVIETRELSETADVSPLPEQISSSSGSRPQVKLTTWDLLLPYTPNLNHLQNSQSDLVFQNISQSNSPFQTRIQSDQRQDLSEVHQSHEIVSQSSLELEAISHSEPSVKTCSQSKLNLQNTNQLQFSARNTSQSGVSNKSAVISNSKYVNNMSKLCENNTKSCLISRPVTVKNSYTTCDQISAASTKSKIGKFQSKKENAVFPALRSSTVTMAATLTTETPSSCPSLNISNHNPNITMATGTYSTPRIPEVKKLPKTCAYNQPVVTMSSRSLGLATSVATVPIITEPNFVSVIDLGYHNVPMLSGNVLPLYMNVPSDQDQSIPAVSRISEAVGTCSSSKDHIVPVTDSLNSHLVPAPIRTSSYHGHQGQVTANSVHGKPIPGLTFTQSNFLPISTNRLVPLQADSQSTTFTHSMCDKPGAVATTTSDVSVANSYKTDMTNHQHKGALCAPSLSSVLPVFYLPDLSSTGPEKSMKLNRGTPSEISELHNHNAIQSTSSETLRTCDAVFCQQASDSVAPILSDTTTVTTNGRTSHAWSPLTLKINSSCVNSGQPQCSPISKITGNATGSHVYSKSSSMADMSSVVTTPYFDSTTPLYTTQGCSTTTMPTSENVFSQMPRQVIPDGSNPVCAEYEPTQNSSLMKIMSSGSKHNTFGISGLSCVVEASSINSTPSCGKLGQEKTHFDKNLDKCSKFLEGCLQSHLTSFQSDITQNPVESGSTGVTMVTPVDHSACSSGIVSVSDSVDHVGINSATTERTTCLPKLQQQKPSQNRSSKTHSGVSSIHSNHTSHHSNPSPDTDLSDVNVMLKNVSLKKNIILKNTDVNIHSQHFVMKKSSLRSTKESKELRLTMYAADGKNQKELIIPSRKSPLNTTQSGRTYKPCTSIQQQGKVPNGLKNLPRGSYNAWTIPMAKKTRTVDQYVQSVLVQEKSVKKL